MILHRAGWTLAALVACCPMVWAGFDHDFTKNTLRVDYHHTGTAHEEHLALHRIRVEGP